MYILRNVVNRPVWSVAESVLQLFLMARTGFCDVLTTGVLLTASCLNVLAEQNKSPVICIVCFAAVFSTVIAH